MMYRLSKSRARVFLLSGLAVTGVLALVLHNFIGTFVFGVFFYYAARPIHRRINGFLNWPTLSAIISILSFLVPVVFLVSYTALLAYGELHTLSETVSTSILDPFYTSSNFNIPNPETILADANLREIPSLIKTIIGYLGFFGNGLLHLFVMLAIAFYLLRDGHKLSNWFCTTFVTNEAAANEYLSSIDTDFNHIFFGNIVNAVITALIGAISYNALNIISPLGISVPAPTLLGLLTGVASLIPVVGMKIIYIPVTAYIGATVYIGNEANLLWFPIMFFAISFVVIDGIPDLILRPYVSGKNLHVGMVMVSYILGPLLFGWYGLFLGPMILVLTTHFGQIIVPAYMKDLRADSMNQASPQKRGFYPPLSTASQTISLTPSQSESDDTDTMK